MKLPDKVKVTTGNNVGDWTRNKGSDTFRQTGKPNKNIHQLKSNR